MSPSLMIEQRDGQLAPFDPARIENAISRAALTSGKAVSQEDVLLISKAIAEDVLQRFNDSEFIPNVENIHDIVEKQLMRSDLYELAKAYILGREERRRKDAEDRKKSSFLRKIRVKKSDGRTVTFNTKKVKDNITRCAKDLSCDIDLVFEEATKYIYDGIRTEEVDKALLLAATTFIEQDPDYNYLAARIFQQKIRKEAFGVSTKSESEEATKVYRESFVENIRLGVKHELYDARLAEFDLVKLSEKLDPSRDSLFKFIGLQTLYERYFVAHEGRHLETPQAFWMRVAMGLSINEENREERAVEFYDVMSQFYAIPSTPTLFHSGLIHPQLSSCYLTTIPDDLHGIFQSFSDNAQMSKWSGGVGNDWTPVRGTGSFIKSTKVDSQGAIPFLKIANDTTVAINRSGKRRGATCAYLETWHLDIEDFLDLRKNTGDERRRTHDMNTANWIPDLFMKRAKENGKWTLFSPEEVPDLHEVYGKKFEERYLHYERMAARGKIKKFKVIEADKLCKRIVSMMHETGHPWLTWKDPCNIRSPQDHVGVVHGSNLCCVGGSDLVPTIDGFFTVEELYVKGNNLTLAGLKDVVASSEMYKPKEISELVKIITKEGYTHTTTPDHKVWLYDGTYCETKDLKKGDKLALQTTRNLWGSNDLPDEAFLAGLWCGDGTNSQNSVHIDIWENDYGLIPEIESKIETVLKKHEFDVQYDHASKLQPKFCKDQIHKRQRLSSSALMSLFEFLGTNKQDKLSVPTFVLRGTRNTVSQFIRGLYLCDATTQGGEVTVASVCSTNLKLLQTLQVIWLNFGAKTSITKMDDEGWKLLPDGKGGLKEYWCNAKYRLFHTSIQSCKIAEEITGLGMHRGNQEYCENLTKDGYQQKMWATFDGLESLKDSSAYCPSVEADDHLWTCNGFLTKNTEITLNTSATKRNWTTGEITELGEVAVCNLLSLNLGTFAKHKKLDKKKLATVIPTAMRMLDNVIDLNFYPIPEAKNSNIKHRPVGLGFMGLQDLFFILDKDYEDSAELQDELMEFISYNTILASSNLAKERGAYSSFKGSKWDRGIFPLDTLNLLEEERGIAINVNHSTTMDWDALKKIVAEQGMRNSNTMAVAPTATISTIVGCLGPCHEPVFKNIFVKSNMTGEFTVINEFLVHDLKKLNLWNKDMLDQIKFHNGSIQHIAGIPQKLKNKYKEVFEVDQKKMIEFTAIRGKWIDQSQSHNIFFSGNSGKALYDIYFYAWEMGLKTTYYLRTLGVSQIEKSTLDTKFGLTQKRTEPPKACLINDPTCEACQ